MKINNQIIILGNSMSWSLEASYQRALDQMGYETSIIDVPKRLFTRLPFRKIMSRLRNILDDRKWLQEMNREIAVEIINLNPKAIIVFCNAEILFNTLALLKTATDTKIILMWPDTPFNISPEVRLSAPLYDLVCSYSSAAVPVFEKMGFQKVIWLPLAADSEIHGVDKAPSSFQYDISFIGHWRPERESAMSAIIKEFTSQRIKITGLYWKENNSDKSILKYLSSGALTGRYYTDFIHQSYINLNIIDNTNFPAANMRFFEVPVAYGFQMSSACPEQENIFLEQKDLMYFQDHDTLLTKVSYCLEHKEEIMAMRVNGHNKVLGQHTYLHRAEELVNEISKL